MSNATTPRAISPNQSIETPWEFIRAVEARFGPLFCDLAALPENSKCPTHIGPDQDSLSAPWPTPPSGRYNWLNPPFANIAPWVQRCAQQSARVLVLVPASVGSRWYGDYVEGKASVHFLAPRIAFTGQPFPKDLMLLQYNCGWNSRPVQWRWK